MDDVDATKGVFFTRLNKVLERMGKPPIEFDKFMYVIDKENHYPSTGQRGMRLVKLIKQITDKPCVTLFDAWTGRWGESSPDLKHIAEYLAIRNNLILSIRNFNGNQKNTLDAFDRSNAQFFGFHKKNKEKKGYHLLNPELLQHYEKRFQTPSGKKMITYGYYGQFGFVFRYMGDIRNFKSTMESGDISQLEFEGNFPEDVTAVESRLHAR